MKKTAVLIYDRFCSFEIAPALEMLAMEQKPISVFAKDLAPVKSEEGMTVLPEKKLSELNIEEYDSLLLPGAMDIREAVEDDEVVDFIREFDGMPIGAISIAPVLLLKAGMLDGKPFMAGINKEELSEEGFSEDALALLHGWDDNIKNPIPEGFLLSGNIVTSVSYNFVRWALAFGKLIGIELSPKNFGL